MKYKVYYTYDNNDALDDLKGTYFKYDNVRDQGTFTGLHKIIDEETATVIKIKFPKTVLIPTNEV